MNNRGDLTGWPGRTPPVCKRLRRRCDVALGGSVRVHAPETIAILSRGGRGRGAGPDPRHDLPGCFPSPRMLVEALIGHKKPSVTLLTTLTNGFILRSRSSRP
jgi:hypothetical protein